MSSTFLEDDEKKMKINNKNILLKEKKFLKDLFFDLLDKDLKILYTAKVG